MSKSTLSLWLRDYPLSRTRINELRGWSERRIEKCRQTKARKRKEKLDEVYTRTKEHIGKLTERELFIGGILLYWAEGTKAASGTVQMTNTDPKMLLFFIHWLETQGIERTRLRAHLHLYADMDVGSKTRFWAQTLGLSTKVFRKPYIKDSVTNKRRNYKGRFGQGTCSLTFYNKDIYDLIMTSIQYLGTIYGPDGFPKKGRV